jgi:hypothetical protein
MATRKNRLYRKSRKNNRKLNRKARTQRGGGGENTKGNALGGAGAENRHVNAVFPVPKVVLEYNGRHKIDPETGLRLPDPRPKRTSTQYAILGRHNEIDAELQAIRNHGIGGHHVKNNYFQHPHPNDPLYA